MFLINRTGRGVSQKAKMVMSEFAPICISLVISLLVSLILLGICMMGFFIECLNSYIQSQTTRKLPLIHADLLTFLISILISLICLWFGIPVIAFCADGDEAGPSLTETEQPSNVPSGASRPFPGDPVVTPIDQSMPEAVKQDEIWDAVDAEERRKEEELRNSKEWKDSERHLLKVENVKKAIGQRAKEIAQERGLTPGRIEAVEDAAKYIAEDVEEIPQKQQLNFLVNLMRDLNNPNSESWERIEEEVKRWRSWEE